MAEHGTDNSEVAGSTPAGATILRGTVVPIHDFLCRECKHEFEELVLRDHRAICPNCGSTRTIKQVAAPKIGDQFRKAWDRQPPSNPVSVYIRRKD